MSSVLGSPAASRRARGPTSGTRHVRREHRSILPPRRAPGEASRFILYAGRVPASTLILADPGEER